MLGDEKKEQGKEHVEQRAEEELDTEAAWQQSTLS